MIRFAGPAFARVDNRLMSLELVEQGLTDAAMFTAAGEVVQASEVLHHAPVLVERGQFRPITRLTFGVLERARELFAKEAEVQGRAPVVLAEMTLRDLSAGPAVDHADFLARADVLGCLGLDVLISRFELFYQLVEYLAAATDGLIGIAVGMPAMVEIAREKYYDALPGGILESTGRLFRRSVRMYVHPTRDAASGRIVGIESAPIPPPWHHFRDLLLETGHLVPIREYDAAALSIAAADVLARIAAGDRSWEAMVPSAAAGAIKAAGLFGYRPAPAAG